MATDLILGTAGHIDHGKTALIAALTGTDTDRLPEEKRRGITIELGFAELAVGEYRLGIVDVPGHERFVRNMLAGATGMDLVMLVVAADDSVKAQTREHLEILRLLDLPAGVIALTKCDLADPDWIDLVEQEVRELVAGSFLADAPIVRVSSKTGRGIDRLRETLAQTALLAAGRRRVETAGAPFRMPVDRVFTMPGHGTVVTGSVSGGSARLGDTLLLEPGAVEVRVRGLQNHDRTVDRVTRGQRAAVNLGGVRHDEIRRGHELGTPGHLVPSSLLTVRLSLLESSPWPLKHRGRVRLHVGTAEIVATAALLDRGRLAPGETAAVQLFLSEPAVTTWNQPLVVRSVSPVVTIGGGCVLVPDAEKARRGDEHQPAMLDLLRSDDVVQRASAAVYFTGLRPWTPADLARTAGVGDCDAARHRLLESGEVLELAMPPGRPALLHRLVVDRLCETIADALEKQHAAHPLRTMLDRRQLAGRLDYIGAEPLIGALLQRMRRDGRVTLDADGVALAGHGPKLSKNERRLLEQLVAWHREAGAEPPTVKQCVERAESLKEKVPELLQVAAAEGRLIAVSNDFYFHAEAERRLRQTLRESLADGAGLTLSDIRKQLGTTRKYAVPFCEYLDKTGFTRRDGDLRRLAGDPA